MVLPSVLYAAARAEDGATLRRLSLSNDNDVLFALATNLFTPADVFLYLARYDGFLTRSIHHAIAQNPAAPAAALALVARIGDTSMKLAVLQHSNTPADAIQRLLQDRNESVRRAADARVLADQLLEDEFADMLFV